MLKLGFDNILNIIEGMGISVMQTISAQQLPNPLRGIEVRAVGRQKVENKAIGVLLSPLPVQYGMMVLCVVGDQNHFASRIGTHFEQFLHKLMEGLRVELVWFSHGYKQSVPQPHGSKVPHAFAAREMPKHRVLDLGWNPHPASRTILLNMNFVQRPQVDPFVLGHCAEFFYAPPVVQGPL